MSELLLELYSEEIPAFMQSDAKDYFHDFIINEIKKVYGSFETSQSWVSPQRIGIHCKGFNLEKMLVADELVRGPKTSAPEQAIEGFLRKNNLSKDQIFIKDEYYFANVKPKFTDSKEALADIIVRAISSYVWPKSMKAGEHQMKWVRPLKNILCILDGSVLPMNFYHLSSNSQTFGHRFLSPSPINVTTFDEYKDQLTSAEVMMYAEERVDSILEQISKLTADLNLNLIKDEKLLLEISGLVEKPFVMLGKIEERFMSLPREVLVITLRHHQRYLMLENQDGALSPYFIIVSNVRGSESKKEIIEGNQRVLRARLSDAEFFVENDKKQDFSSNLEKLKKLTFHAEIGNMYEKVMQTTEIAKQISDEISVGSEDIERASQLSKCDLITGMVKEFPELQGVMGYYYALNAGENKEVASAIRDHYKPNGPNDSLPSNLTGKVIALAEKIYNLNSLFSAGIKPTGSKDPYAQRRAALGIIRIIESDDKFKAFDLSKYVNSEVLIFINERKANN